ncbi:unnamed protein product [Didymodactylos carnosus]|uniref:Uncharacterized protein n=1 Tax=Didymodactylos carnosus TaxID=1234261 RepID=A0A813RRX6_9BILA|nr:unnamed protein product [Didymodactylos carnosus]CAF1109498.1 unnamed protein product [Didymodactylos carnosus]CAF3569994.1 unnamed protein product [Didymodactylos carnosus]CAF3875946.1 unnamed protein product [Didymodactylos carnosus]
MMVEDEDDEEVILDKRTLFQPNSDSSSPIGGVNRFNIKVYEEVKLSKVQTALLGATCVSIGIFAGILGPTFVFFANKIQTDVAAIIWLISMKASGFFIGTLLSVYLYDWFNTCCLLGLSCLSISFGVCALPMITDLATFYLTALILGVGLAISNNGIDTLYNRLWTRRSLTPVRWLHLLLALGAVLSTLLLVPTSLNNDKLAIISNNTKKEQIDIGRPRRQEHKTVSFADKLADMTIDDPLYETHYSISNTSLLTIDFNSSLLITKSITTTTAPSHPPKSIASSLNQTSCLKIYCCYNSNETKNASSSSSFVCRSDAPTNQNEQICKQIMENCQEQKLCLTSMNYLCKIDEICNVKKEEQEIVVKNCSIPIIDMAHKINIISLKQPVIIKPNGINSNTTEAARISLLPTTISSSSLLTTSITTTTMTATLISNTIYVNKTLSTINSTIITIIQHHKPSYAKSDADELSKNLFYRKAVNFFHSIHSIQVLYLFLSLCFFLLGILYSILAMRGTDAVSGISQQQPAYRQSPTSNFFTSFFVRQSSRQRQNISPSNSLLFADNSSLKFISTLILFYFFLSSIEHSSIYLTYLFGIQLSQTQLSSLLIQFSFFIGLFLGRLFDIFIEYGCYLFYTRVITRAKKQSNHFHSISLKCCILICLFLLFIVSSTLTFSHLFKQTTTDNGLPSKRVLYLTFFLIGFIIALLSNLILTWLEQDLTLNDRLIKIIVLTMTTSEILFPSLIYYTMRKYILSFIFYLFLSSLLSLVIFVFLLYSSKKWQRKRLYRILPTSMDVEMRNDGIDDEDGNDLVGTESSSDNEQQQMKYTQSLEQKTHKLH